MEGAGGRTLNPKRRGVRWDRPWDEDGRRRRSRSPSKEGRNGTSSMLSLSRSVDTRHSGERGRAASRVNKVCFCFGFCVFDLDRCEESDFRDC